MQQEDCAFVINMTDNLEGITIWTVRLSHVAINDVSRRVRGYLDRRASSMMYNALILLVFDYCNVVVGNGKTGILTGLQRLQNRGRHIILGWNKYSHSSDILR